MRAIPLSGAKKCGVSPVRSAVTWIQEDAVELSLGAKIAMPLLRSNLDTKGRLIRGATARCIGRRNRSHLASLPRRQHLLRTLFSVYRL